MNQRIQPAMAQVPRKQRRGSGAIDIVVAEDRNLFNPCGGVRDALRGDFHLRHRIGIRHQFADGGVEIILDRIDPDIATRKHPRQHLRQSIALRDRKTQRGAARIEPIAP